MADQGDEDDVLWSRRFSSGQILMAWMRNNLKLIAASYEILLQT